MFSKRGEVQSRSLPEWWCDHRVENATWKRKHTYLAFQARQFSQQLGELIMTGVHTQVFAVQWLQYMVKIGIQDRITVEQRQHFLIRRAKDVFDWERSLEFLIQLSKYNNNYYEKMQPSCNNQSKQLEEFSHESSKQRLNWQTTIQNLWIVMHGWRHNACFLSYAFHSWIKCSASICLL